MHEYELGAVGAGMEGRLLEDSLRDIGKIDKRNDGFHKRASKGNAGGENIFQLPSKLTGKCESKRVFVDICAKVSIAASRNIGVAIDDLALNSNFPFCV
jgi:hypothetical protein